MIRILSQIAVIAACLACTSCGLPTAMGETLSATADSFGRMLPAAH